jgi:putative addiction module component (TIGR02574 family)
MSTGTREILDRVMELPAVEKARLIDQLLSSLDEPDETIDALWRKEVEDRIQAYQLET